jgi:hypothetical protein
MAFKFTSQQPIKSVSQRALASHWDRLAAGRHFPAFTEFTPDLGIHDPKQLVVWNVEGEGRSIKFRALFQGNNVEDVFNSDWVGKTMEQVVPMSLRRYTLDAAKECAASGCLVYTIVSTIDTNDNRVDCERLLLPYGRDGSKVEQILASLQLTSVQGEVRRRKILNHFQIQADLLFASKIKATPVKAIPEIAAGAPSESGKRPPAPKGTTAHSKPQAPGENRRASRRNILRAGRIKFARQSLTCTVRNISATGASIEGTNLAGTPDNFTLMIEMESSERRCTVVWRKKTRIGVHFS